MKRSRCFSRESRSGKPVGFPGYPQSAASTPGGEFKEACAEVKSALGDRTQLAPIRGGQDNEGGVRRSADS